MVNSLDLTTLITQIPHAQKLHNVQQVHPEMQQALAQQLALKKQQEEKKQVTKPEKSAAETQVDKDGHQGEAHYFESNARHSAEDQTETPEPDSARLIDIKV